VPSSTFNANFKLAVVTLNEVVAMKKRTKPPRRGTHVRSAAAALVAGFGAWLHLSQIAVDVLPVAQIVGAGIALSILFSAAPSRARLHPLIFQMAWGATALLVSL